MPLQRPDSTALPAVPDTVRIPGDVATGSQTAAESIVRTGDGLFERLVAGVNGLLGFGREVSADIILSLLLIAVLWAIRTLVLAGVRRRSPDDVRRLYQWRKGTTYVAVVIGFFLMVRIWVGEVGALATYLGLLSAGVAIALRDPLVNLAGWGFILWRRPFSPGDRVGLRGHTGDVIDQRLFQFTLLETGTSTGAGQSTGRIIHVPNGWVFSDSVVNHTGAFAYVWNEVAVVVTFESDWRAAKQILLGVASDVADDLSEDAERTIRRAARDYFIFYSKLTPTVYTSVVGEGVQLTIRYLVEPRRVRGSEQDVWEAVLDRFAERDDIDLAYPTTRMFRNNEEGKPGAGGPARPSADWAEGATEET